MPPIRSQNSEKSAEKESRVLLAIQAINNQEFTSIRGAARFFTVPQTTLRARLRGVQHRAASRANSHKLTEAEEQTLEKWILSMQSRGSHPRAAEIRELANTLLLQRGTTPVISVGANWATNFMKRHPLISSRFSRRDGSEREDPEVPSNNVQLQQQESSIEALLHARSSSPPSSEEAIDRVLKACKFAMESAALLEKEAGHLHAVLERMKQTLARSRSETPEEGDGLSVQDASQTITQEEAVEAHSPPRQQTSPPLQPRTRALPTCSLCKIQGHKRNVCPDKSV